MVEGFDVLRSTAAGQENDRKDRTIEGHRWQSDGDSRVLLSVSVIKR